MPEPRPSWRPLDWAVFGLWAFLAAYTASLAHYYVLTGLWHSRPTVIVALSSASAALLPIALWGRPLYKGIVLGLFACFLTLEIPLQVLALLGRLPGLAMVEDYAPYARVYTHSPAAEENSIANRYGWHAREFRLEPGARRVALIGDSFIHAPDVHKSEHMAVHLERLLAERRPDQRWEVLPLGISGTGPSYYLQILRYAKESLGVHEAVLFVTQANDFMNSVPEQMSPWFGPPRYIYYSLNPDGTASLDPESGPPMLRLWAEFKLNHSSLWWNWGRTLRSHIILERALKQILDRGRQPKKASGAPVDPLIALGIDPFVMQNPLPPQARRSTAVTFAILKLCAEYARQNGITLRLVAIPLFTPEFYERKPPAGVSRVGPYDIMQPERLEKEFAAKNGLPFMPLGSDLRRALPPADIWNLFLYKGYGHFNARGHEFVARDLFETFFARPARR